MVDFFLRADGAVERFNIETAIDCPLFYNRHKAAVGISDRCVDDIDFFHVPKKRLRIRNHTVCGYRTRKSFPFSSRSQGDVVCAVFPVYNICGRFVYFAVFNCLVIYPFQAPKYAFGGI